MQIVVFNFQFSHQNHFLTRLLLFFFDFLKYNFFIDDLMLIVFFFKLRKILKSNFFFANELIENLNIDDERFLLIFANMY